MNKNIIIFTILSIGLVIFGIIMTTIGILNISTLVVERDFHSKILNDDRNFIVYLPPGYDLDFFNRYPVLYMLDGERYFKERKEESKYLWSMKKTLDRLIKEGSLDKMIVVGVYSTEKRTDQYTPSFDEEYQAGGQVEEYTRFLIEEIKPAIDKKYRTLSDAEHTGVAGSSLGGLASFYIGWNHPEVFSKIGALSPSLWWNNYEIKKDISSDQDAHKDIKIWMDTGKTDDTLDSPISEQVLIKETEELKELLVSNGFVPEKNISLSIIERHEEIEQELDQRLEKMLLFLYSNKTAIEQFSSF
jgi:predicted alpha/beta superfamily hydrolase